MCVCPSVRVPVCRPKFGSTKASALPLRSRHSKFLHRPKRLRCHSASAGAATQRIAPPTRAPAGRGPTDARHSRHARSRSHHGHRAATVTPESLQAAGKLLCATTLSSLDAAVVTRRRRRVTSFAFPSGGAPTGASLHLRLPLRQVEAPWLLLAPYYALCWVLDAFFDARRSADFALLVPRDGGAHALLFVHLAPPPVRRRRPGADYADCIYGTDCADCGPRFSPHPPICDETCNLASDAGCDVCGPGPTACPSDGMSMWTGASSHVVK